MEKYNDCNKKVIKHLCLDYRLNSLGNKGVQQLGSELQKSKLLQSLFINLSDNRVEDEGLSSFSQGIQNLKSIKDINLNLQGNRFGDQGLISLLKVIFQYNLSSLCLEINNNFITEGGYKVLLQSILSQSNLAKLQLSISDNLINDIDTDKLNEQIKSIKNLKYLDLQISFSDVIHYFPKYTQEFINSNQYEDVNLKFIQMEKQIKISRENNQKGKIVTLTLSKNDLSIERSTLFAQTLLKIENLQSLHLKLENNSTNLLNIITLLNGIGQFKSLTLLSILLIFSYLQAIDLECMPLDISFIQTLTLKIQSKQRILKSLIQKLILKQKRLVNFIRIN